MRLRPAGIFVVFGVLQLFEKAALAPDVLADAAGDHAEKMVPANGLPIRPETAIVVACVNSLAVGPGNLPPEDGRCFGILERRGERPEPSVALGRGICV